MKLYYYYFLSNMHGWKPFSGAAHPTGIAKLPIRRNMVYFRKIYMINAPGAQPKNGEKGY